MINVVAQDLVGVPTIAKVGVKIMITQQVKEGAVVIVTDRIGLQEFSDQLTTWLANNP